MNFTGLDLLFLEVNNLEESLGFYSGVLDLEIDSVNMEAEPPIATLRAGALKITCSTVGDDVAARAWCAFLYRRR